jgi:hypothetical protein
MTIINILFIYFKFFNSFKSIDAFVLDMGNICNNNETRIIIFLIKNLVIGAMSNPTDKILFQIFTQNVLHSYHC